MLVQGGVAQAVGDAQGIIKGRVVDASGAVARDAVVSVYAMPMETAERPFKVGDKGTYKLINRVKTDSQGNYAVAASRSSLASVRDRQGNLNVKVMVTGGGGGRIASELVGLAPAVTTASATVAQLGQSKLVPSKVSDLVLGSSASGGGASVASRSAGVVTTAAMAASDPFVDGKGASPELSQVAGSRTAGACGWSLVQDLGNRNVLVGATYIATSGVTADFQYLAGVTSKLGVASSKSGKFGSYDVSGSASKSSTASVDFPSSTKSQHGYTKFRYGKFGSWCDSFPDYKSYDVTPRYWSGGASISRPASIPTAKHCLTYEAKTGLTLDRTRAATWSTGVGTSSAIGLNLSSETGYSRVSKLVYKVSAKRKICGVNDGPLVGAGKLVARS